MANRVKLFGRARAALSVFDAARSAAAAVESGRRPDRGSLERLGIDPEAFIRLIK
jgi:hypothetical protein